jgi:anti-anti-sigma factor
VQSFAVEVLHADDGATLALAGELDVAGVPELAEVLELVVRNYRADQVVLDCTELAFMDASGLGLLVKYLAAPQPAPRPKLRGANRAVLTILRATDAVQLFDVEPLATANRNVEGDA